VSSAAVMYAVVALLALQVADLIFPALDLPPWTMTLLAVLALFGFPLALVLAWATELTPEGFRRQSTAPPVGPAVRPVAAPEVRRALWFGFGLVVVGTVGCCGDGPCAWYEVGVVLFHFERLFDDDPLGRAVRAFQHAYDLDPVFGPAQLHLIDAARVAHDTVTADRIAREPCGRTLRASTRCCSRVSSTGGSDVARRWPWRWPRWPRRSTWPR
jgi:hypothetical protein